MSVASWRVPPIWEAPKVLSWADPETVERGAITMTAAISRVEIVQPYLALMPDVHIGIGACIGTVIPTVGALIPAAIGVDIGCGMIAERLPFTAAQLRAYAPEIRKALERRVPSVSFDHRGNYMDRPSTGKRHRGKTLYNDEVVAPEKYIDYLNDFAKMHDVRPADYTPNWPLQLGSLGGGNHFIEIVEDETGGTWLFLHSGSRGIGNRMATHHMKAAQEYCRKKDIKLESPDHAYLVEDEDNFASYWGVVKWAQKFAFLNRIVMLENCKDVLATEMHVFDWEDRPNRETIACHHNYTEPLGDGTWLTRKGAISAEEGQLGLIPGSMGTASYVVSGLGDTQAFKSAPHGAGRRMARGEAKRTFTVEDLEEQTRGVEARIAQSLVDEIPGAYKDIDAVMTQAASLVKIEHRFRALINVKGD